MKRRWLRWWPAWLGLMIFAAFCCLVAARAQRPDFDFLAGHEPTQPEDFAPFFSSPGGVFRIHYSFEADPKDVIRQADRQLTASGWMKNPPGMGPDPPPAAWYQEPGGLERSVWIWTTEPLGPRGASTIGVTILRPDKTLDWQEKAKMWFGKVFLGRP